MIRSAEPFVIDMGGAQIILTDWRDGTTSLAVRIGAAAMSSHLSAAQKLALAKALCDSARRGK